MKTHDTRAPARWPAVPRRLPVAWSVPRPGLQRQRARVSQILHGPRIQRADHLEPALPLPTGVTGPPARIGAGGACVPTTAARGGGSRSSSAAFEVYYEKDNTNRGEITLRQREAGDRALHTVAILGSPSSGNVTIPSGVAVDNENHHFELEMVFYNSRGVRYGGLGAARPPVPFQVCALDAAPTGDDLLFAQMLYAEGSGPAEFPFIRDLVYNRIDWVQSTCTRDRSSFGEPNVRGILTHSSPPQFASVLGPSAKFEELADELNDHSGLCQYTTPPRPASPERCRLVNAAVRAVAAGDQNTHDYLFFRSDTTSPSPRAVNRWQFSGGNYYWEISGC